jgi:ATP-dependent Clp protease ATP-binding subunit ClpA
MFERFSGEARAVVATAQDEARALRHPFIGTEHLLLALLARGGPGGDLLTARGMGTDSVRQQLQAWAEPDSRLDAEALRTLGIDLDQVRRAVEEQFGPGALAGHCGPMPRGHLRFTGRAKAVLELTVREAQSQNAGSINSAHLLLGLIQEQAGLGSRLIRRQWPDIDELTAAARARAGEQAA